MSGFRAVQSGNSIAAGQHLRFITACAAVYMVILIVNFLVAVRSDRFLNHAWSHSARRLCSATAGMRYILGPAP